MDLKSVCILLTVSCLAVTAYSQNNPDVVDTIIDFPSSFFSKINKKTDSLEEQLTRPTEKISATAFGKNNIC